MSGLTILWMMDKDLPDASAYHRSTNPERFAAVVEFAEQLIDTLETSYEVESSSGDAEVDFRERAEGVKGPTVRLTPSVGVPLVFGFTSMPGVLIRVGNSSQAFPDCGCDACDLQVDELSKDLQHLVDAAIAGRYVEDLTRRKHRWNHEGPWGRCSNERRLRWGEWKLIGERGWHRWPAWRKR